MTQIQALTTARAEGLLGLLQSRHAAQTMAVGAQRQPVLTGLLMGLWAGGSRASAAEYRHDAVSRAAEGMAQWFQTCWRSKLLAARVLQNSSAARQ